MWEFFVVYELSHKKRARLPKVVRPTGNQVRFIVSLCVSVSVCGLTSTLYPWALPELRSKAMEIMMMDLTGWVQRTPASLFFIFSVLLAALTLVLRSSKLIGGGGDENTEKKRTGEVSLPYDLWRHVCSTEQKSCEGDAPARCAAQRCLASPVKQKIFKSVTVGHRII